jgi:NAD(P)-dependent dehydrogenase (short-subunit alcohol dehydrogenase family)
MTLPPAEGEQPMAHEPNVPAGFCQDLFRLDGQVAIVTGGASGLGEAMAHGMAQAGATVIIADFDKDAADRVAASVADRDYALFPHEVDVTKKAQVDALVESVAAEHGTVDIIVNSAGTAGRFPAEDFPEDEWDRIITLNLKGSFLCCQAAGRQMIAAGRGGSIINIASIGASIAYPHATAYNQSKGGVLQMTRSLALEWIGHGIRVNALAPTLFNTPLVKAGDAQKTLTSDFILRRQLIDRKGEPHEIAGPAVFLASAAASMVTGHMLQVDAGYLVA